MSRKRRLDDYVRAEGRELREKCAQTRVEVSGCAGK